MTPFYDKVIFLFKLKSVIQGVLMGGLYILNEGNYKFVETLKVKNYQISKPIRLNIKSNYFN